MHRQRTPKKLDLRRQTVRRLATLSEEELRRAIGGRRSGDPTDMPSISPTGDGGC